MFDGSFKELIDVFVRFGKTLFNLSGKLIKTAIFWIFAMLPSIIGFIASAISWNLLWVVIGIVIELVWAYLLIMSDQYR